MSSALKDARWQLALGYAEEDGHDWDALNYAAHEQYLAAAQAFLDKHGTPRLIEALASAFRSEG